MLAKTMEEMELEITRLNAVIDALKLGNKDLSNRLEKLRKIKAPKIKMVIIDKGPALRDELLDLYERNEMLLKENEILKESASSDQKDRLEDKAKIKELNTLLDMSDQIVSDLEEQNKNLKSEKQQMIGKIMSLEITINSYKDRERKPIIYEGSEHDFYQDEIKEFVVDSIKGKMQSLELDSRAYDIGKSLIEANPIQGIRDTMRKEVLSIFKDFRGYIRMPANDIKRLKDIGIELDMDYGHGYAKFICSDKYFATISNTPSCSRGLNDGMNIVKALL